MHEPSIVPQDEISRTEALSRKVYYIAQYDARGRLITLTKMYRGKPEYKHSFKYDDRGNMVDHTCSQYDNWKQEEGSGTRDDRIDE